MTLHLSNRESVDEYAKVLFDVGLFRVIECRHSIQWIIQKRRSNKAAGGAEWDAVGYCQTRRALDRLCRANIGAATQEFMALPERFARCMVAE